MRTTNRNNPLPHNLCSFTSSLCACLASSVSIECIFSTYRLVWSNISNSLDADKPEKLIKIYQFYRAEEDNHLNLLKLFQFFFFSSPSKFVAVRFVSLKKCTSNCTSVLLILLFTSWYIFQRKSKAWNFWWVLLIFLSGLLKKNGWFFCLGPITSTLKIVMDV